MSNGRRKEKRVKSRSVSSGKAVISKNSSSYADCYLLWSFQNIDRDGHFAFNCGRDDLNCDTVLLSIVEYSGRKWKEIDTETHDNGKSKHHFLEYDKLSFRARQRIVAKRLQQDTDLIFSLRLSNKVRIIGLRKDDRLEVIWFDPEHDFCPSTR
jgi:hypothetical protein